VQEHWFETPGRDGAALRLAYTEWGAASDARAVLCVHGLTRNGRDFDVLAAALAGERRVICPDVVGRGKSDWLADSAGYANPAYVGHILALLKHLEIPAVDWIGTSMGGLIGMLAAASPESPVRSLLLNDIGAVLPRAALERIGAYAGADPSFDDLAGLETYLRETYAGFGPLTDGQWRHMAEISARPKPDGRFGLAYDPAIGDAFKNAPPEADVELWPLWDALSCPVMVLRGATSDVLPADVAAEMTRRGPRAQLVEFAGVGHAPALMSDDQIAVVRDWLAGAAAGA
jgi:pimeloyl-ACP methyl ester carboxylesterase